MKNTLWKLRIADPSPASRFAAEEFARLVARIDPGADAELSVGAFDPKLPGILWIGLDPALPAPPAVDDPAVDDAIRIEVKDSAGFITGSNPRSVLIAVYRFFRELGAVFLRPGRDGELLPQRDSAAVAVSVAERAAFRHRGICLEGSNAYENVAEMIDFAPKLGFNAYFTQLFRPAFAFTRWYGHTDNPALLPTPVTNETIDSFVASCDREIRRRGMIHHRIGHGWASRLLGITSGAWHEKNDDREVRPDRRELIALINGERRLFDGSGIDTNLCYSDPRTVELLADEVAAYAKEHPQLEYLHFWLADKVNNQCECERCNGLRPADQYVGILNRIDEKLTEAKSPVKIVFLIYLDLLWAPVRARLKNPERFALMYAPIRRSYSVPMATDGGYSCAPFRRNGFVPPPEAGATLPYLEEWQRTFDGDAFIFDYPYMWDYLNDPGCFTSLEIMAQDVENLRSLRLNGMMSCQNQRVFMPNGFGMNLMGDALWSGRAEFAPRAAAYFAAAYGPDGAACMAHLEQLSRDFDPNVLRGETPVRGAENAARYAAIPERIDAFLPTIRRNLDGGAAADPARRRMWECLAFHAELCRKIAGVLAACAEGDRPAAEARWAQLRTFACANETRYQREFDLFEFLLVWEKKILPRLLAEPEAEVE